MNFFIGESKIRNNYGLGGVLRGVEVVLGVPELESTVGFSVATPTEVAPGISTFGAIETEDPQLARIKVDVMRRKRDFIFVMINWFLG